MAPPFLQVCGTGTDPEPWPASAALVGGTYLLALALSSKWNTNGQIARRLLQQRHSIG